MAEVEALVDERPRCRVDGTEGKKLGWRGARVLAGLTMVVGACEIYKRVQVLQLQGANSSGWELFEEVGLAAAAEQYGAIYADSYTRCGLVFCRLSALRVEYLPPSSTTVDCAGSPFFMKQFDTVATVSDELRDALVDVWSDCAPAKQGASKWGNAKTKRRMSAKGGACLHHCMFMHVVYVYARARASVMYICLFVRHIRACIYILTSHY
jgi:hypothetical protein